jgi:endo-1,4-beta-D-glucanase Y
LLNTISRKRWDVDRGGSAFLRSMALSVVILCCFGCQRPDATVVRSDVFLESAWKAYKETFISPEGYVWDRFRDGGEVTSEGQSYALLRAAWLGDAETFERVFAWTEANLLRDDGMYSWQWRPGSPGSGEPGRIMDPNTATDADQDIALALIIAARVFERPDYRERAREIVRAVRRGTRLEVGDGWFISAGNWANAQRIMNISYFMPYSYPLFHELDPEGDWLSLRETGYDLLHRIVGMSPTGLLPDFNVVEPDGKVRIIENKQGLHSDFSFDAMRTYWRVAMDCLLHDNPRACADPARTETMARLIARDDRIKARYAIEDGQALSDVVSVSFSGSLLPAFRLFHPPLADALLQAELSQRNLEPILHDPDRYYDLNWIWFGLAADTGLIQRRTPR